MQVSPCEQVLGTEDENQPTFQAFLHFKELTDISSRSMHVPRNDQEKKKRERQELQSPLLEQLCTVPLQKETD